LYCDKIFIAAAVIVFLKNKEKKKGGDFLK